MSPAAGAVNGTDTLTEVLRECHAMMVPQGRKRGIKMTFPPSGIPYFVNADRTRLKQVLVSLLSNAIKYNRLNGTVVVDCAPSTSASTPERIRASIGDTGAGLSPDMLPQLFQPFNRLGRERSAEEGTGIGLAMSKRLVELMGGVIGAESTIGSGSVFWFELNSAAEPRLELDRAQAAIVEVPVAVRLEIARALRGRQPGESGVDQTDHRAQSQYQPADHRRRS